jgi:Protein of unknown function (DUF3105)
LSKASRRAGRAAAGPAARASGQGGTSLPGRTPPSRAGRRERARTGYARKSFFERYRGAIISVAILAAVGVVGAILVTTATAKSYSCGRIWVPDPTPVPSPGQSPRLGYVQQDMGATHNPPVPTRYTLCPPASGSHFSGSGIGPIAPRVYGPDDYAPPQGWLHNLEHGAIVVLYRGGEGSEAVTEAGQAKLRLLYRDFPLSPICGFERGNPDNGVVIARFDDMDWPYAAIVWDRVLPLQTLDANLIYRFWATEGERTNPENRCQEKPRTSPSPSAAPNGSVAPSGSPAPSPAAS